jgi:magnesium transporter
MEVLTSVEAERLSELVARDEFFWLDLATASPAELDVVGDVLGLHALALEDTKEFGQRPKVDVYEESVLCVFFTAAARPGSFDMIEVHIHLSGGYIITVRHDECLALDDLHEELRAIDEHPEDEIVYRVLDVLTDAFYPVIDAVEVRVDALEAQVLTGRPRREQLEAIYRVRQDVHAMQRRVLTQRDQLLGGEQAILALPGLTRGSHMYLRDVGDHLAQIGGELTRQNDDLQALTATYFNASATRLTQLANRVTLITVAFLVWTLVTSFFVQNFAWLVRSVDTQRDFLVWGVGGLVVPTALIGALFWIKRHDWF